MIIGTMVESLEIARMTVKHIDDQRSLRVFTEKSFHFFFASGNGNQVNKQPFS